AGLQYRRQPRRLAPRAPRERGQGDELVVPQMVRPGRGAHGDLGGRSEEAALSDRRHLGALHFQCRQYPLPDDGRPQRSALSGRATGDRRRLARGRGHARDVRVVEVAGGTRRQGRDHHHRRAPHVARDHGRLRRLRGCEPQSRRDVQVRQISRPEGASYLYFLGDQPKAQAFENYLAAHPGAIDLWVGGHTHTHPADVLNGRSHVERKWGVNFVNCAQLSKFHSYVTCPPMSRHFTFTEGSRLVRVRCYLHDDTHAAEGWYPTAERVLEFSKPFYWD